MTQIVCGVDISSASLQASIGRSGAVANFTNNPEGIAELVAFCHAHPVDLVAMEATGGYERQAFALLSEHGLPVAVLNPLGVRQFAQSMGRLEPAASTNPGTNTNGTKRPRDSHGLHLAAT